MDFKSHFLFYAKYSIRSREFSHRIKGVGHSAFTAEEAQFLSDNGNDAVNAKYLANFSSGSERLRAPDGTAGAVDGQLLRVWLRRKYIDGAWAARSAPQQNGGGQQNQHSQPTRVQIPPKKSAPVQAQAPATDLLGGGWDSAPTPAPAPAPVANDAAWDAFGQSRTTVSAPFQADFGSQPSQPAFQAAFGQMPTQPPPSPAVQVQARAQMPHQSPDPPQQQASSFNPNFPQPSTPNRSYQAAPAFEASFPDQLPSQPVQHQQMNGSSSLNQFNANFQQPQPPTQSYMAAQVQSKQHNFNTNFQQQQQPPAPVQQAFNTNFQQQQQQPQPTAQVQQNQQAFNANFQQQQQPQPTAQVQQNQQAFNANFQQQQQQPSAQMQQNQNGFNANFQQQQQSQPTAQGQQNQQGFNANFQQQQQPAVQQDFNTNFQQQQQPAAQMPKSEQSFDANFQQHEQQQPPAQIQQTQQGFNANFQQQQPAAQMPKSEQGFDANFQQQQQQPPSQIQQTQQGFNANSQQQQQPPAQIQHTRAPQVQSSDSHTQAAPDVTVIPVPNQFQPSTALQMSDHGVGVNNSLQSVPSNGSSIHLSSAVGREDSADPFDAFSSLAIGINSSSLPPPEAPSMAVPAPIPPKVQVNSGLQYKVGEKLAYRDSQHNISLVEVLKVHLDDELMPFYDIRMENGKEKQTDNGHLSVPSADMTASSSEAVVSKETMLTNITALLGALDVKQLCTVEKFLKDMQGIQG